MFTKKQSGDRAFVPFTRQVHRKPKRKSWATIGTAIILISMIIATVFLAWSALT